MMGRTQKLFDKLSQLLNKFNEAMAEDLEEIAAEANDDKSPIPQGCQVLTMSSPAINRALMAYAVKETKGEVLKIKYDLSPSLGKNALVAKIYFRPRAVKHG